MTIVRTRAELVEAIKGGQNGDTVTCASVDLCGLGQAVARRMGKPGISFVATLTTDDRLLLEGEETELNLLRAQDGIEDLQEGPDAMNAFCDKLKREGMYS